MITQCVAELKQAYIGIPRFAIRRWNLGQRLSASENGRINCHLLKWPLKCAENLFTTYRTGSKNTRWILGTNTHLAERQRSKQVPGRGTKGHRFQRVRARPRVPAKRPHLRPWFRPIADRLFPPLPKMPIYGAMAVVAWLPKVKLANIYAVSAWIHACKLIQLLHHVPLDYNERGFV